MRERENLAGKKFGKLTVISYNGKDNKRHSFYKCVCECGRVRIVRADKLKSGSTVSCGKHIKTHGKRYTRIYDIWCGMKQRCYNSNSDKYRFYGAKGVIICDEWKNNFQTFYEWAMKNGYKDNLTIDRIDPYGNYEPSNCRWATLQEQQLNKRKK